MPLFIISFRLSAWNTLIISVLFNTIEMSKFIAGWYVLYTRPHHEKKVVNELSTEEMDFYFPTRKSLRTWHDRKKVIDAPLFQSYVFVYLKDLKEYFQGLKIKGVLQYVKIGKEVVRVNDRIIDEMKLLIDYGKEVEVTTEYFQPGQHLLIQHGPLTGRSCEVVQLHNKQRILVRINLLQRNLLISFPSDHLMAISA
jgi:transcription antitermination factor NusG